MKIGEIKNSETGEVLVEMVGPPNALSKDAGIASKALYELSELLIRGLKPESRGGFLGGEFGYGADFENDVFMMHHYCWCGDDSCLWCGGCQCKLPPVRTYLDGKQIKNWSKANDAIVKPMPSEAAKYGTAEYRKATKEFNASIKERDRRLKRVYPKFTHSCEPAGLMENREKDQEEDWRPPHSAPNFWHKSSGLKFWWYKWIGRDMQANRESMTAEEFFKIYTECRRSIPVKVKNKALRQRRHESTPEYIARKEEAESRLIHMLMHPKECGAPLGTFKCLKCGKSWTGTEHSWSTSLVMCDDCRNKPD